MYYFQDRAFRILSDLPENQSRRIKGQDYNRNHYRDQRRKQGKEQAETGKYFLKSGIAFLFA